MIDLLIYRRAYERHQAQLDGRVRSLVIDDEGVCTCDGRTLDAPDIQPEIAWANRDLYTDGPVREFMVACLKSRRLKWFQSSAAGFEHPVFAKLVDNGVALTNANASAVPIAEFVFAQVLDVFHPNMQRRALQGEREWQSTPFRDVARSTWLIFGLGSIGAEVAVRAKAFGAYVIGARRSPMGDEPVDEMVSSEGIREHVARADVIVLTAALNEATRHTVDADFISRLKDDAVLVNVGRGGLIDEAALLEGLARGRPAHAVLDVFDEEPLPQTSPFWDNPRVRLTAHCAGASEGTSLRGDEIFLENLARYLDGEPLAGVVTEL
jgi:phosphoglycerate dehydrogenase-like enzyme